MNYIQLCDKQKRLQRAKEILNTLTVNKIVEAYTQILMTPAKEVMIDMEGRRCCAMAAVAIYLDAVELLDEPCSSEMAQVVMGWNGWNNCCTYSKRENDPNYIVGKQAAELLL